MLERRLHHIVPDLTIPATTGERLLSQLKDLFLGGIDEDFSNYGCNVSGEAKPETLVDVYELVENATFQQIFGDQDADLNQLCLTQDQIATFVENHHDYLHPKGYATFFLFKVKNEEGEEEFFVANVSWDDVARRLGVDVCHFSSVSVWGAGIRYRVVFPQLTPKP